MTKDKPNCYKCKYRGEVVGSAHSSCQHPAVAKVNADPILNLMGILASVGRVPPITVGTKSLNVRGSRQGIEGGWFNWPFDFDPTWLENCDGFTEKDSNQ